MNRSFTFSLLTELARECAENTTMIVEELIRMHHTYNESLSKEFEYEPPIERRAACNFVGLKNAGATCYMNSVLQQLYNVPNISDQVSLEEDNLSSHNKLFLIIKKN
jgi:ubiquitin carboxyl-terminal hydrolase 9/24